LAVVISALVFAMAHESISSWPFVFVSGMVYALLRERRGSLIAPLTAHATANLLLILIAHGLDQTSH
jgi:membrane protease YdiL (CAAX protease family)